MGKRRFFAAFAALTVFAEGIAGARPGGGGSYHGGGGGGGGGHLPSGGWSGGSTPNAFGVGHGTTFVGPPNLTAFVVLVSILLTLLLVFAVLGAFSGRARRRGGPMEVGSRAAFEALRARDPRLTEAGLDARVRAMADILRHAWCGGDMRPARPFVSDGVYSRFQVQLALMALENRRNVMSDARVLSTAIVAVEDAEPLDVVHVRVTAAARDIEVRCDADEAQVRRSLQRARILPYTEIWSLVRRRGAQSKPAEFTVGLACPACGAPLAKGEIIRCIYCGALVCSGEYDWVLAEITQDVEWRRAAQVPPGFEELRSRDSAIAREVIEDRASYGFWKWAQAARLQSTKPLQRCATSRWLATGAALEMARTARDVAVGGAELVGCGVGQDGFEVADVKVYWSTRFEGNRAHSALQTVVRLLRRSGVQSTMSMTALVCQACSAPLSESDSPVCEHCGAQLTDGGQAWVLDGIFAVNP
jgi:hypothetical protein